MAGSDLGRVRDRQRYINLRGYDPDRPVWTAEALAGFLRALEVVGEPVLGGLASAGDHDAGSFPAGLYYLVNGQPGAWSPHATAAR